MTDTGIDPAARLRLSPTRPMYHEASMSIPFPLATLDNLLDHIEVVNKAATRINTVLT